MLASFHFVELLAIEYQADHRALFQGHGIGQYEVPTVGDGRSIGRSCPMDGVDFTLLCPGKVGDGRCLCIGPKWRTRCLRSHRE